MGKIFGTVKSGHARQVVVLCTVNTTKYYLGGLVSGRYEEVSGFIEVVFKTGSTVHILANISKCKGKQNLVS